MKRYPVHSRTLVISKGDLAAHTADAIVNAANAQLAGGGGVDGALHRAAGPELLKAGREHFRKHGPVPAGDAAATPAFALDADIVIHAVGPVWHGGNDGEPEKLASAYRTCLKIAHQHGARHVAFPAISCGVYGFPVELAAPIALGELMRGLEQGLVDVAEMVLHGDAAYEHWTRAADKLLG